jgi:hypothetical protein
MTVIKDLNSVTNKMVMMIILNTMVKKSIYIKISLHGSVNLASDISYF